MTIFKKIKLIKMFQNLWETWQRCISWFPNIVGVYIRKISYHILIFLIIFFWLVFSRFLEVKMSEQQPIVRVGSRKSQVIFNRIP